MIGSLSLLTPAVHCRDGSAKLIRRISSDTNHTLRKRFHYRTACRYSLVTTKYVATVSISEMLPNGEASPEFHVSY